MTELLSPSPYAYLDALPPSERLAARRLQEHRRNAESGSVIDTARRARDLQAELAEADKAIGEMNYQARDDIRRVEALRTMCAELIEDAGQLFGSDRELGGRNTPRMQKLQTALARARKLLEGE